MSFYGILTGLIAFAVIGAFHPIVIKAEFYFSRKIWPAFLIGGILFILLSVFSESNLLSSAFSIVGFTCLWSIKEIIDQEKRVQKGWFPDNPNRKHLKQPLPENPPLR